MVQGAGRWGGDGLGMVQNNHNESEKKTKNELQRGATRPATQVGVRPIKVGLGGHDDGASGVDGGVEKSSTSYSKVGPMAWSDHATFSGFVGSDSEFACENKNDPDQTESPEDIDSYPSISSISHSSVSLK